MPVLPVTVHAMSHGLQEMGTTMGTMWVCSAQLETEKTSREICICMLDALHTHRGRDWGGGTARATGDWGFAFSAKGESWHKICLYYSSRQRRHAWCSAKFAVVST